MNNPLKKIPKIYKGNPAGDYKRWYKRLAHRAIRRDGKLNLDNATKTRRYGIKD